MLGRQHNETSDLGQQPTSSGACAASKRSAKSCQLPGVARLTSSRGRRQSSSIRADPSRSACTGRIGLCNSGICKIGWKNTYFLLMGPLWKLCLPLCVLPHAFWMTFSHFRNASVSILLKNGPGSEVTSHKSVKLALPARYVVYLSP